MSPSPLCVSLSLVLVTALSSGAQPVPPAGPKRAQNPWSGPPKLGPEGSAFPELKPPTGPEGKDVTPEAIAKYQRELNDLLFKDIPAALPKNPTPLQRVRYEQAREGIQALRLIKKNIEIGNWTSQELGGLLTLATDVHRVAADLEPTTAGRVRCYERRVILFKEIERFCGIRFEAGSGPHQDFGGVLFRRLQAEADLLTLKSKIEDVGPRKGEKNEPGEHPKDEPGYTAFLDLKPPKVGAEYQKAMHELVFSNGPAALPDKPLPIQKIRHEQACEGLWAMQRMREDLERGNWDSAASELYPIMVSEAYLTAAELEDTQVGRVRHYEIRIVILKAYEQLCALRFQVGNTPLQVVCAARFHRLQAEADLLILQSELIKAGPQGGGIAKRVPARLPAYPNWALAPGERDPKTGPDRQGVMPNYTAYPKLLAPVREAQDKLAPGQPRKGYYPAQFPDVPPITLPPKPSPNQQIQYDRVAVSVNTVSRFKQLIEIGNWRASDYEQYCRLAAETYRTAAKLHTTPADQIRCLEAGVIAFKELEQFSISRFEQGFELSRSIFRARFERLGVEAELYLLTESPKKR